MTVILLIFAVQKTNTFLHRKEVFVLTSMSESYYDADYEMTAADGLNIAVAFTGYDTETESTLDESYGRIVFRHIEWGLEESMDRQLLYREIPSHQCSNEEMEANVMPILPISQQDYELYRNKFRCTNTENLRMQGSYNSVKGRMINV